MAHTKKHARRLVSGLDSLTDPAVLLSSRSYADPGFFDLFLDYLDGRIFDEPISALPLAQVAPELALKLPSLQSRERLAKAHAVLGGAYRAAGRPGEGDEPYRQAIKLAEAAPLATQADIQSRLSQLRICQQQPAEAEKLALDGVESLRSEQHPLLAEALTRLGYVYNESNRFGDAVPCFGEALELTNPKESARDDRVHHSCVHNLCYVVIKLPHFSAKLLRTARDYLQASREIIKGQRQSVPRHKLHWVEGHIWIRLGAHRRAEQAFKLGLRGFKTLQLPFETALVSLDLGALHHFFGEWRRLELLAGETFTRFRQLAADTEAIAALSLWRDAAKARTLTDEITGRAKYAIESRLGPGGCCKGWERNAT